MGLDVDPGKLYFQSLTMGRPGLLPERHGKGNAGPGPAPGGSGRRQGRRGEEIQEISPLSGFLKPRFLLRGGRQGQKWLCFFLKSSVA
jgi:hypothetical protein